MSIYRFSYVRVLFLIEEFVFSIYFGRYYYFGEDLNRFFVGVKFLVNRFKLVVIYDILF